MKPIKAEINLHGSFAETYQGHGTDMALLTGLMGWHPDDGNVFPMLKNMLKNMAWNIHIIKIDLGNMAHPNTVLFRLTGADGSHCEIVVLLSAVVRLRLPKSTASL